MKLQMVRYIQGAYQKQQLRKLLPIPGEAKLQALSTEDEFSIYSAQFKAHIQILCHLFLQL